MNLEVFWNFSHHHLGLGILPPDAAHVETAGLFIMYISHGSKVMRAGENSIATKVKFTA